MNIVLIGPAGSGKGTQASIMAKKFDLVHISTGDLLRNEVASGSEQGRLIDSYINEGKHIPDTLMREILKSRLQDEDCTSKGVVLDGYPRNIGQAEELDKIFKELNRKIDKVFEIQVLKDILLKRISGRFSCKKCGAVYNKFFASTKTEGVCDTCGSVEFSGRKDDSDIKAIEKRFDIYEKVTKLVLGFYEKKGLIYSVDGSKSVETVALEIEKALNDFVTS